MQTFRAVSESMPLRMKDDFTVLAPFIIKTALVASVSAGRRGYMSSSGSTADLPNAETIARLLARLACNCHSICDNNLNATGIRLGAPFKRDLMLQRVALVRLNEHVDLGVLQARDTRQ